MAIIDLDQTHPRTDRAALRKLLRRNRIEWVRREYPDIGICHYTSWLRRHVPPMRGPRPDQPASTFSQRPGWWRWRSRSAAQPTPSPTPTARTMTETVTKTQN